MKKKGIFFVVDGLDGAYKMAIRDEIARQMFSREEIFELDRYQKDNNRNPRPNILMGYETVTCSEPSYWGIGKTIRDEMLKEGNPRCYAVRRIAAACALDRGIHYDQIVLPCLKKGITVLQSRGLSTSLVYQPVQAQKMGQELTIEEIMNLEGNETALNNLPDLLLIATTTDVRRLVEARNVRRKNIDRLVFDNTAYQEEFRKRFESDWLRKVFEEKGTIVKYIDVGVSIPEIKRKSVELWKDFLEEHNQRYLPESRVEQKV